MKILKLKGRKRIEKHQMLNLSMWARIIGLPYHEFVHMPIGELGDMIEMYQRINGMAEPDDVNESEYIPSLR